MESDAPKFAERLDDPTLLSQFEDRSLPFERWKHGAHLRVAYLYLSRYPFDEAFAKMRAGIQTYNRAHDVPEGPDRGYHETMTGAWLRLIDLTIREYGPYPDSESFLDDHPQLSQLKVLRFFYSRERLLSPGAKVRFLEPDLAPLPVSKKA